MHSPEGEGVGGPINPLSWVVYKQFQEKKKAISPQRPPGQLQARMTHQQTSERFEKAHCLVKNTVALQEAENGALLCSMEIANKPRSTGWSW